MSQKTTSRSRRYFARTKEERKYNRWLINSQGAQEYNLVEKLKIKKGGKHAAEVYRNVEMSNLSYWEMTP
jgi:hypothetical protein